MSEDSELMLRVQQGDEAALGALMRRWEIPLKRLLARIVFNTRDAEELAQAAFVRVWERRSLFRPGAEFRPWLFSVAVNLARNRLRWWRRRPEVALEEWLEFETAPEGGGARIEIERRELAAAVQSAVAQLPLQLREALVLQEYEAMSHAEIAAALGCTAKAVENRIHRAREKLKTPLARWLQTQEAGTSSPRQNM